MSKKIKFYTKEEDQRILEVGKNSTNIAKSAKILAKEFGRTEEAIKVRLYGLKNHGVPYVSNLNRKSKFTKNLKMDNKINKPTEAKFQDRTITIPIKSIIIQDNNLIITH